MSQSPARRIARGGGLAVALALFAAAPASAATLQQTLRAGDTLYASEFGTSVAIDGDTAVVGRPEYGFTVQGPGSVYVFLRTGNTWTQTARLTASDGVPGDGLGSSVAIEGDTIVAGAQDDDFAGQSEGSAYTFSRTGPAARTQTAKLTAADGAPGDRLGTAVEISGATIVAGAPGDAAGSALNQGSVYTFARAGAAARTQTAKLTASDGDGTYLALGTSVAIDGDLIVAGAPGDAIGANGFQGSVYVFAASGAAARSQTGKLTSSDGAAHDSFGWDVALEGDTIVAGAPNDNVTAAPFNPEMGSAYTFARTGAAQRTETAKLTVAEPRTENLGYSVAIAGDTIVAGAPFTGADHTGTAHLFTRTGAARVATESFADPTFGVKVFGHSVAIGGGQIFAGSTENTSTTNPNDGAVSVYVAGSVPPVGTPPPAPGRAPAPPPAAPVLLRPSVTAFAIAPKSILIGPRATVVSAATRGGRFSYTLSLAARVKIVIDRKLAGHRSKGRCLSPKRGQKRNCTRYARRGTLSRAGKAGKNTLTFSGRIGKKALAPGTYRARITATNAAGNSAARTATFKVIRAPRAR
ncbi:MAG: hypothetical protein QOJ46_88 [bacterium]